MRRRSNAQQETTLALFERAMRHIEGKIEQSTLAEYRKVLENPLQNKEKIFDITDGLVRVQIAYETYRIELGKIARPLLRSLLESYSISPKTRPVVERLLRYFSVKVVRSIRRSDPKGALQILDLYEALIDQGRTLLAISKEILQTKQTHEQMGSKVTVGNFILVDTGGYGEAVMGQIADLVKTASSLLTRHGFGKVCYGEVFVTRTISRSNVRALYHIQEDKVYIRANVKKNPDTLRDLLHELGHRYETKFMRSRGEVDHLYNEISRQETDRIYQERKELRSLAPPPGDRVEIKGVWWTVVSVLPSMKGQIVHLKNDAGRTGKIPLEGYLSYKVGRDLERTVHEESIGFVTEYAKRGGPKENFADMFSFYCLDRLPTKQISLFESAIR